MATVVAYHNSKMCDLEDNKTFSSVLEDQRKRSIDVQELENNFANQIVLFKRETTYQVYFTVETDEGIDDYITQGKTAKDCIEFAESQRNLQSEYIKELLNKVTI